MASEFFVLLNHLRFTFAFFAIFLYIGIWFTCFSDGPAAWMEGSRFTVPVKISNGTSGELMASFRRF